MSCRTVIGRLLRLKKGGKSGKNTSRPGGFLLCTTMSGHKEFAGKVISPKEFKQMAYEHHWVPYCRKDSLKTIRKRGGILAELRKGEQWKKRMAVASVKHPIWRAEYGTKTLRDSDIGSLYPFPEEMKPIDELTTGVEFELLTLGGTADEIIRRLDTINEPGFSYGREFRKSCIELGTIPSSDENAVITSLYTGLQQTMRAAEEAGMRLLPLSLFAHKVFTKKDITDDKYLHRMTLGHMTWKDARHFIGESIQIHVEMTGKDPLLAVRQYATLSAVDTRHTAASPFGYGRIHPDLAKIYRKDEKRGRRKKDKKTYKLLRGEWDGISMRYPARWRGSPSGGVRHKRIPRTYMEYMKRANKGMQNCEITSPKALVSPARVLGDHTDIRVRVDMKPNGTLEICNKDTSGGHQRKLVAEEALTKRLVGLLEYYASEGKMKKLAKEHPLLFHKKQKRKDRRKAHLANIISAREEGDVMIHAANGEMASARHLYQQLLEFVAKPLPEAGHMGLPPEVLQELQKSNQIPAEDLYSRYRDAEGIVSVAGFYESGVGTLSHWLKKRARQLMQSKGLSEEEAVNDCMNDLSSSYHEHLRVTPLKELLQMLKMNPSGKNQVDTEVFTTT